MAQRLKYEEKEHINTLKILMGHLPHKIISKLRSYKPEKYLFILLSLFYISLWILNPSYKFIVIAFILLIFLINIKLRNLRYSLLFTFLASIIVFTGKTYTIKSLPPGIFDTEVFPDGYLLFLVITPGHVVASIMLIILIRDLLRKRITLGIFNKTNLLLLSFFVWTVLSSLFGSKQPDVSLSFSLLAMGVLILYFYLQAYVRDVNTFLILLTGVFSSFILFESLISIQQFVAKAPLHKNLEAQLSIEYWGKAADELEFTFRPLGTFHHANSLAANLVFWLTFVLAVYLRTLNKKLLFIFMLGTSILIMTLSRSAWLGFFASLLTIFYIIEKIKKKKLGFALNKYFFIFLLVAALFSYHFVLPRAQTSIYSIVDGGGSFRLSQVEATWEMILSHPVFGVGKKMMISEGLEDIPESIFGSMAFDVHNWYLLVVAEQGIPAFIIFIFFVVSSIKPIFLEISKKKISTLKDFITIGFIGAVFAFFVIGVFQATSGDIYIISLLGVLNRRG